MSEPIRTPTPTPTLTRAPTPIAPLGRLLLGLAGLILLLASCGDDAEALATSSETTDQATTTEPSTTVKPSTSQTPPTTETSDSITSTTAGSTTSGGGGSDEGQDTPVINDWRLDVESLPCEVSDLPGSPGGEAVLPATWAAGNADFVNFIVDGDQRPANSVRDVVGPGNIQVPCDPALNDGHEVTMIVYTGSPGSPGPGTTGQTFIVVTTATVEGGEGAASLAGDWVLTTMGPANDQQAVSMQRLTTLSFDDGELWGDTPCNRYRALYITRGNQLTIESVSATTQLCEDPDLDRQESDYLLAIDRASSATIDADDTLVISDGDGNELRFRRE